MSPPIQNDSLTTDAGASERPDIYDLVVVGGGPVGSMAAYTACQAGLSHVLVLEEHASVGTPVQCAGLLSVSALREAEIDETDPCVLSRISGAHIFAPSGECLTLQGRSTMAYAVSRKAFDQRLSEKAASAGAVFKMKTKGLRVERIRQEDGRSLQKLTVLSGGVTETIDARIVIAADGVRSTIARSAGLSAADRTVLSGVQTEVSFRPKNTGFVEIYIGSRVPGFFAWAIPLSEKTGRIGLAVDPSCLPGRCGTKENAMGRLENLMRQTPDLKQRTGDAAYEFVAGAVPIMPLDQTYAEGLLIAGDAAGQCKPISGGGIVTGLKAARAAGEIAARAVMAGDVSEEFLKAYETRWKEAFGKEIDFGRAFHRYRKSMTDAEMDILIRTLNDPDLLRMITLYGDIDHPSVLIRKLLFSKQALRLTKIVGRLIRLL